jgi:putative peptide zinc metalloprotease protein
MPLAPAIDSPASRRPLPLCRRKDLIIRPRDTSRGRIWIVKDPVSLRYYELSESEHALWQRLDGSNSREDLQEAFAKQFAPRRLESARLEEFLIRLFRQGLVISTRPGQGEQFAERVVSKRWQDLLNVPQKLLAFRLRGIDPDAWLTRAYPLVRWLVSPAAIFVAVLLVVVAATVVFTSAGELARRLPRMEEFFRADNLLLLALTLAIVKVLHELGHALACKHFGGEVHELGLMFLFFTPCLYCDVSDAWLFRSRRARMAVSAAGMYVEIILAAIATILWSRSQPGLLNQLCLNVMVVCGVGTLLINGNPLMRYDGYYLLSDAWEIPNLDQQARSRLRRFVARWLLGADFANDSLGRERPSLVLLYGALSTAYRLFILVGVLWMLHSFLQPLRLDVLATLASTLAIGAIIATPTIQAAGQLQNPLVRRRLDPTRIALRLGSAIAVLAAILCIPLPARVKAPGVIEARRTQTAYATVAGKLIESKSPGDHVHRGDVLARLENPELTREIAQLASEAKRLETRLRNLEAIRAVDVAAASEIPTATKLLADVQQRLAQLTADERRLTIRATQAGLVLSPPRRPKPRGIDSRLPAWSGSLLDPINRGAYVEAGTIIALVSDPTAIDVVAIVDQAEIGLVAVGQPAYAYLRQGLGERLQGVVTEISQLPVESPPAALAGEGDVLLDPVSAAEPRLLSPAYQVRIELSDSPREPVIGGRATARVVVASQSLAARFNRYLRRTFRW